MKTRSHIVTQTCVYETAGLYRSADAIASRMGSVSGLKNVIGYSRVLIRIIKIILDLTLHNDCFIRRRNVLETPRLRQQVTERLGGAPALLKWRRQNTWNKARLAAIASGEYRPPARTDMPVSMHRPRPIAAAAAVQPKTSKPTSAVPGPAKFRLPVLQNLRYVARRRGNPAGRAKPETRFPSVVLWPHELDGQYVPDFQSRVHIPYGMYGEYSAAGAASGYAPPAPGAPP